MRDLLARIAGFCVERPLPVLAATALVTLVAAVGALGLEADAGTDQLVDRDSDAFVGTEAFKREFGDDAVVVLVKGDLEQLVLSSDLGKLLALEACLSGKAPGLLRSGLLAGGTHMAAREIDPRGLQVLSITP